MSSVEGFSHQVLRKSIGQICQTIGWNAVQSSTLDILSDQLKLFIHRIGRQSRDYAEFDNRTTPILEDLQRTLDELGVGVSDLQEYVEYFDSAKSGMDVSQYPRPTEDRLNFLKPGSREVLHRKVHINEYFPPMYPELEAENGDDNHFILPRDLGDEVFKKPDTEKISDDNESRLHPLREISSVIMTSSGFISPAREGKLPDARTPSTVREEVPKEEVGIAATKSIPKQIFGVKSINEDMKGSKGSPKTSKKIEPSEKGQAKLSIFGRKPKPRPAPPPAVSAPPPPQKPPRPSMIDDTIESVISQGVGGSGAVEEEDSEEEEKPIPPPVHQPPPLHMPKRGGKRKVATTPMVVPPSPPSPPPVSPPPIKKPKEEPEPVTLQIPPPVPIMPSADLLPGNPLIPRTLYGFDSNPVPQLIPKTEESEVEEGEVTEEGEIVSPRATEPPKQPEPSDTHDSHPKKLSKKKKMKKEKDKDKDRKDKSEKKDKDKKKKKEKDKERKKEAKAEKLKDTQLKISLPPPPQPELPKLKINLKPEESKAPKLVIKPPVPTKVETKKEKKENKKDVFAVDDNFLKPDKHSAITTVPKITTIPKSADKVKKQSGRTKSTETPKKKESSKTSRGSSGDGGSRSKKRKTDGSSSSTTTTTSSSTNADASTSGTTGGSAGKSGGTSSGGGRIVTQTVGHYVDTDGNQIWICPACGKQDDGSPMIGCDDCDDWYHWLCVGIQQEPEENQDWFCMRCVARRQGSYLDSGRR